MLFNSTLLKTIFTNLWFEPKLQRHKASRNMLVSLCLCFNQSLSLGYLLGAGAGLPVGRGVPLCPGGGAIGAGGLGFSQ